MTLSSSRLTKKAIVVILTKHRKGLDIMEYLTKEEVVKIIKQRFENRRYIRKPTTWRCMLTGGTIEQRQSICLYPIKATPKGADLIIEFEAANPNSDPPEDWISRAVENSWNDFTCLSQLRRVDFETDLLQGNRD